MRIHHVALRVTDCSRSADFYSGLLGLPELRRFPGEGGPRAVWVRAGEAVVMLERALKGAGADEGSGHVLVFAVQELAAWEARLREAGIPIDDRTAYTLYVRDPDGHRIGLSVYRFDTAGA
ncbi:MAG: glyoxalase [Acidobacteria bacterium]|nr:MAG: glyoxalase [Acidobacteriota bacterium]PYQ22853.1 MAG: glyoxalase [Acidobacteriota bacterium]